MKVTPEMLRTLLQIICILAGGMVGAWIMDIIRDRKKTELRGDMRLDEFLDEIATMFKDESVVLQMHIEKGFITGGLTVEKEKAYTIYVTCASGKKAMVLLGKSWFVETKDSLRRLLECVRRNWVKVEKR